MYILEENPLYLLLTGESPNPIDLPGRYLVVSPFRNGLFVRKQVGKVYGKLAGKTYSKIDFQTRKDLSKIVVVDTQNLDTGVAITKLKQIIISGWVRRNLARKIIFTADDPQDFLFDQTAQIIIEALDSFGDPIKFEYYCPNMPKIFFSLIFGFLHPDYTKDELLSDANIEFAKACTDLNRGKITVALESFDLVCDLLDASRPPKSSTKIIREDAINISLLAKQRMEAGEILSASDYISVIIGVLREIKKT